MRDVLVVTSQDRVYNTADYNAYSKYAAPNGDLSSACVHFQITEVFLD